ncbi:8569_t:CDS:2, partial [Entrophospora sp. SA101]
MSGEYQYYRGYTSTVLTNQQASSAVCTYIKRRNDKCSFSEFIDLYQGIIIDSSLNTDDWSGLESTWQRRFLRAVKDIIPDKYDDIFAKGYSVVVLAQVMVVALLIDRCIDLEVKSETSKKSLMDYWQNIINEKGQISVINNHIFGSLKILDVTAKHNTDTIISKVSNHSLYKDQIGEKSPLDLESVDNNDIADTTTRYGKRSSELMSRHDSESEESDQEEIEEVQNYQEIMDLKE